MSDTAWDRSGRARARSDRARGRFKKSCYLTFHLLSYPSAVRPIELGISLTELGKVYELIPRTVLTRVSLIASKSHMDCFSTVDASL